MCIRDSCGTVHVASYIRAAEHQVAASLTIGCEQLLQCVGERLSLIHIYRYEVNHDKKRLNVYASPSFGYQPFTPEKTEAIYRLLRQSPVSYTHLATLYTM